MRYTDQDFGYDFDLDGELEDASDLIDKDSEEAEPLTDGRYGLRIHVWDIESRKRSILSSSNTELWEQKLHTCHVSEMVFGDSGLFLEHVKSGATIHFNSFDALVGWKKEALPPVEVPAAAQWKFRTKPSQQVIMDYDYIFTTPYSGSETLKFDADKVVLYEDELADIGVSLLTRVMPTSWFLLL
ncbi:unnamed protein product [Malus baccata var. baccata]